MAHRRRVRDGAVTFSPRLLFRTGALLPLPACGTCEPEEGQTIPASAGDLHRDRAERGISPVLISEPFCQDFHKNGPPLPVPAEHRARQREATIQLSAIPVPWCCMDALAANVKEVSWRDHSQVGVLCDLECPPTCPFR